MSTSTIKTSFASGEWAPKLRGRVDIQKYHAGAALMRNFYVDFSGGGASTRQGTKFINQVKAAGARIVPFQPSTSISYVLEFGQFYIRFFSNGAPIVEAGTTITGVTQANPGVVTDAAHGYINGQWVLISGLVGMTQLNGNYYIVAGATTNTYALTDLNGNPINTTGFGAYVSGGIAQRVYEITSPYAVSDLFPNPLTKNPGIKWVQNVTSLIITHPSYSPTVLTIQAPTNWNIGPIVFGALLPAPTAPTVTSTSATGAGINYGYAVTAVDANGLESAPSVVGTISNLSYIGTTPMTNKIAWTAVSGAVSYNVYKNSPTFTTAIASGAPLGFIGNTTGVTFLDSYPGIVQDFSQSPPIVENPFQGAGVQSTSVTAGGSYTTVPGVTFTTAPAGGVTATGTALMTLLTSSILHGGGFFNVNDLITFFYGIVIKVTSQTGGVVTGYQVISTGSFTAAVGTSLAFTLNQVSTTGTGTSFALNALTWAVQSIQLGTGGAGYTATPTITFSSGAATATATLGTTSTGNPGVPGFIQERLALAAQAQDVQGFNFSQPGGYFNFNVSNPSQSDDAISGTIISEELNDIRWLVPVPTGIIAGTGKGAWLINGGGGISTQVPITPSNVTAQPQSFTGSNDLRPIKINFDILYVTNKGNYVRDLTYNLYAQTFTGSDISVLSNHLFFGYYQVDWCHSEEPFKTTWAVRNDGQLLSLAYVKDQELIGWSHHDTNGQFLSTCSVIETVGKGNVVDAVYFVIQRIINGVTVQYVERMADRFFDYGYEDAWSVDCALQTVSANSGAQTGTTAVFTGQNTVGSSVTINFVGPNPGYSAGNIGNVIRASGGIFTITTVPLSTQVTAIVNQAAANFNQYTNTPFSDAGWTVWIPNSTVTGLTQLIGQSVVGVADGAAIGPFTVSATGSVALGLTATKVTLGLSYLPQLQTLPLDLGEPTVQGKRKKITGLTLRVADTLGLSVGKTFQTLVPMKDLILGNVPTTSTGIAVVNGLVNGDARTILDQEWDTAGNYCIQQNLPYPATVLAAMPEVIVGDK
jgi:hypothetical protein